MRTQEDKYIASQLNSLNSLPEGYQANISSKWEMVQMGMEQKKRRSPVVFWMAAAACLLLMLGAAWFYTIGKKQEPSFATNEGKQQEGNNTKQNATKITVNETPNNTVSVKASKNISPRIAPNKTVAPFVKKESADTSSIAINNLVQENILPKNVEQKLPSIDSMHTTASAQQTTAKKSKQRFYQMDFGEGSANDPKQKVASNKLIQFKFSSKGTSDGNSHTSSKTALPKITQPL